MRHLPGCVSPGLAAEAMTIDFEQQDDLLTFAADRRSLKRSVLKLNREKVLPAFDDWLATEEPLEIRLAVKTAGQSNNRNIAITMRTPGDDVNLVVGFLFSEGIIQQFDDIEIIRHCGKPAGELQIQNTILVTLKNDVLVDWQKLQRNFIANSSCGVCGKSALNALDVELQNWPDAEESLVDSSVIFNLLECINEAQPVFARTGGLHAAALFDRQGSLLALFEDVGRHNALDKLIGMAVQTRSIPLSNHIIFLSGRIGFELVQKSLRAGASILAAVGAPSSLAVDLALKHNLTLVGFVRGHSFNIYSGRERLR